MLSLAEQFTMASGDIEGDPEKRKSNRTSVHPDWLSPVAAKRFSGAGHFSRWCGGYILDKPYVSAANSAGSVFESALAGTASFTYTDAADLPGNGTVCQFW